MFSSMFWSKRKNIDEKNNISGKNKTSTALDEFNDKSKDKKSKKFDKNSSIFKKFRKSFIKAKSMDNNDAFINKNDLLHKHSSDNLVSNEKLKPVKNNSVSLRRMFTSNKPKTVISSLIPEVTRKENSEFSPITTASATPIMANTVTSSDFRKCSIPAIRPIQRPNIPMTGIINHGNTCYINSIMQCLNSIDVLVQYFVLDKYKNSLSSIIDLPQSSQANGKYKDNVALLLSFSSFLKSLWFKNLNCDILSNDFKVKLATTERNFRCNDQQDAQEFLLFLLNYCHETLKLSEISGPVRYKDGKYDLYSEAEKIWSQNRSIIHTLFVTHQQLTISCPGCSSRQYKLEPHLCLSLPVPAKTMEPLYYCFIEKDGSQICAAMWINTVSLVQYVRANIAHKFRIDVNKVVIMIITESGFGKCFQDSEQAVDLISPDNANQPMSNLWNGIVALEIQSAMSTTNFRESNSMETKNNRKSIRQMKNSNSPVYRTNSGSINGTNRNSGHYDNLDFDDCKPYDSSSSRDETISQTNIRHHDEQYLRSNINYPENVSNDTSITPNDPFNLVIIHVEEIFEKAYVSSWRRFSAPVSLLVRKEIEFNDLEKLVIAQLEAVYHCIIQSKLKTHLKFWVWDGLNNTDAEITSDYQFPLLTEAVESIVNWCENTNVIRMVAVWCPGNGARLMQTVFTNLRLSHSLGREVPKTDAYNGRNTTQSLALMDAWSSIEENGSVELVTRATLSKRSQASDSRNISLEDCLKAYVSEEVLDAKDAWKCPNCHKFQRATISNSIYSLPDILVLHLKRFQSYSLTFTCNEAGKTGRDHEDFAMTTIGGNNTNSHSSSLLCENNSNNKLNILVDYPLSGLDMKSYLSTDAVKNSSKKLDSSDYFYDLIAVCNHQGTLSTGHYTAFCRSSVDFKWRLFNDDVVREVSTDKVIQANAYILFYQRRSSIVCPDQHWSCLLNSPKYEELAKNSSPQSYKTPILDNRKEVNFPKNIATKPVQNKSDPPIRRVPYQTNKTSNLKNYHSSIMQLPHSNLHRPLPLDNNCNSIRNNTPIVDADDDDFEDDDDTISQGSTSYDEYIPASVTKRPLKLHKPNSPLYLSNSKSH